MPAAGLRINYYISGHGFGHATRSARIAESLLEADPFIHITVITTAPGHLFPVSDRLIIRFHGVDSAVIQPQPYSIDASATFADLKRFLRHVDTAEWQATAAELLHKDKCQLILADAPCPFAWASHAHGIPTFLISNFSFDAIFRRLLACLPNRDTATEEALLSKLEQMYSSYDYLVRLPGYIDFPFVRDYWTDEQRYHRVLDAPLVFRSPKSSRDTTLRMLGVPQHLLDSRILVVQFGGQRISSKSVEPPTLPSGWICLSFVAVNDPRFFLFPTDVYSPDLIALSDTVLGKIGGFSGDDVHVVLIQ